jgi:DNA-binding MarR family transcriptional regulator
LVNPRIAVRFGRTGTDVQLDEIDVGVCTDGVRDLANAVRVLDAEYRRFRHRVASAAGISLAEFDALTAVTWAESEGDVTPKRVAEATRMTSGAMTSLLDRLAAAGLLQRQPHPNDRRSVVISLTPAGRELVGQLYRSYVRAFEPVVAGGTTDVQALVASLQRLREAVEHADDEFHPTPRADEGSPSIDP